MLLLLSYRAKNLLFVVLCALPMQLLLGTGKPPTPNETFQLLNTITKWEGMQYLGTHIRNAYQAFCALNQKDKRQLFVLGDIANYSGKHSNTTTIPLDVFARLSNIDRMYQQLPWYAFGDRYKLHSLYQMHLDEICDKKNYAVCYRPVNYLNLPKKCPWDPNFKILEGQEGGVVRVIGVQCTDEHRYGKFTELLKTANRQSSIYESMSHLRFFEYAFLTCGALKLARASVNSKFLKYTYCAASVFCCSKALFYAWEFWATQPNPDIDIKPDLE